MSPLKTFTDPSQAPKAAGRTLPDAPTVVVTASVTVADPPRQVWHLLVDRTAEWWTTPYLAPDAPGMRIDPTLGGSVWSGATAEEGDLHGVVRRFDPPNALEIGGVLVPGAFAGTIRFELRPSHMGTDVSVTQSVFGEPPEPFDDAATLGWDELLHRLAALTDG